MQDMQRAIEAIIGKIPQGMVFDSHFVINRLIKEYSQVYLSFVAQLFAPSANVTAALVNGRIALLIKDCGNVKRLMIGDQELQSWSENIHTNCNECACWRKI